MSKQYQVLPRPIIDDDTREVLLLIVIGVVGMAGWTVMKGWEILRTGKVTYP